MAHPMGSGITSLLLPAPLHPNSEPPQKTHTQPHQPLQLQSKSSLHVKPDSKRSLGAMQIAVTSTTKLICCCCWLLLLLLASTTTASATTTSSCSSIPNPECAQTDAWVQQQRSQRLTANVLAAVAQGTIKQSNALHLLQDVSDLRASLESGAAAARWTSKRTAHHQQQYQEQQQPSCGILVVAGGTHQLRNALILLKLLSHPNISCTLPVEVVYYGAHEFDAGVAAAMAEHAQAAGVSVKLIDGSSIAPTGSKGLEPHRAPGRLTGFKAKVHALVWVTSFDQVNAGETF